MKRIFGALAIAALVSTLIGCVPAEPRSKGAMTKTAVGEIFALCQDYRGGQIQVFVAPLSKPSEPNHIAWTANTSSEQMFTEGAQFVYGNAPVGFHTDFGPQPLDVGTSNIWFGIARLDPLGNPMGGIGVLFDGSKVQPGKWLDQDGNLVNSPCG